MIHLTDIPLSENDYQNENYYPKKRKRQKHNYVLEPVLNSELILVNNSKKLKNTINKNNQNYNNIDYEIFVTDKSKKNLEIIEELRDYYRDLSRRSEEGEKMLQAQKREVRDKIRELSLDTYVIRNSDYFMSMVMLIIDKIASRPHLSNYTFKDEMKSLAIEHILLYTHKFDPTRQSKISGQYVSAFSYISTIVFNAFKATIKRFEKEQQKLKERYELLKKHDNNESSIIPEFEDITYNDIYIDHLDEGHLIKAMKSITIKTPTRFIIPDNYIITPKDYDYIMKYEFSITVTRHSEYKKESKDNE